MELHERLKGERERLGLTQPFVAKQLGVGKTTVINWEKGASAPDAFQLASFAKIGADVSYILTEQRCQAVSAEATLPKEERGLLDSYRRCGAPARKNLLQTAALLSAGLEAERPPKQRIKISAGGHAAGRDMTIKGGQE